MSKKTDPLTIEEMTAAADIFFPLFNIVNDQMPKGATTEDALHVMESIAKLAHKQRSDKREEEVKEKFGFHKIEETEAGEAIKDA